MVTGLGASFPNTGAVEDEAFLRPGQADIRSVRHRPARRKTAAQPMKTATAVDALIGTRLPGSAV